MSQIEPTAVELMQFLGTATSKGWIGATSGRAMMSTLRQVQPLLDETEAGDVREIDIDGLIKRFANLNRNVGGSTLKSYASRLASAIKMFSGWREDPKGWKPRSGGSVPTTTKKTLSGPKNGKDDKGDEDLENGGGGGGQVDAVGRLSYPFPLREGVIVKLVGLPPDLTQGDVERISRFLRVLCID